MSTLKPGALALIINSTVEENIGQTVRCVQALPANTAGLKLSNGLRTRSYPHVSWEVETVDGKATLFVPTDAGYDVCVSSGSCKASWLMPIGDEDYAKQVKEVLENVY